MTCQPRDFHGCRGNLFDLTPGPFAGGDLFDPVLSSYPQLELISLRRSDHTRDGADKRISGVHMDEQTAYLSNSDIDPDHNMDARASLDNPEEDDSSDAYEDPGEKKRTGPSVVSKLAKKARLAALPDLEEKAPSVEMSQWAAEHFKRGGTIPSESVLLETLDKQSIEEVSAIKQYIELMWREAAKKGESLC